MERNNNASVMAKLVEAANKQFGEVIICGVSRFASDEYKLMIKRRNPVFKDRPYMTITGSIQSAKLQPVSEGKPHFYWGHYDMTEIHARAKVFEDIQPKRELYLAA